MASDDELIRAISENVPDTMNTRQMDFDLRDERLAKIEERVEEAIADLDQRTPSMEHPFEGLEDLNGNPIEGEQPEIRDVRSEGVFREDWTPPNVDNDIRLRIAAYGFDLENPGSTIHAIRRIKDSELMRKRILGIQYRSGLTVKEILADAVIIGLLYLSEMERKE